MELTTVLIYIAIAALVLTGLVAVFDKGKKNLLISFLQNFCGSLFIFSGAVKVVDPLGTAYKMEQYFDQFESVFEPTWMSFLVPVFDFLNNYTVSFAVFVVVLEIVLGIMLLLGSQRKFTAWAFFLLVVFFTFLTGFTYLTGFVPNDVNFFDFANWGEYVYTNMKVTDCGCFGDFIVLEPKISFYKDIALLVPSLLFLFTHKKMHQVFSRGTRIALLALSTIGLTVYAISNYVWDIPDVDFRPFKEGVNVRETKQAEYDAQANVDIIAYKATNKADGRVVEIPYEQYLKEFKNYPKSEWSFEQIKTEPAIKMSKISEYEFSNEMGENVADEMLADPGYSLMIVANKLKFDLQKETFTLRDSIFATDTVQIAGSDSTMLVNRLAEVKTSEAVRQKAIFAADYLKKWNDINPTILAAQEAGLKVYAVTAYTDQAIIDDFRHETQSAYPFYTADDIMLKTIIRSNPGIVLWRDGTIVKKWHESKLPDWSEIQTNYVEAPLSENQ